MSDEGKLTAERERGHKARQVLDNPVFKETWDRIDANLIAAMSSSTATDEAVLEARKGLIVLRRVRKEIEREFETGNLANIQLGDG
jgi:hypothetical protein